LKDVWFARKKKKTVLNVAGDAKTDAYETNAHYRRILVTPLRINASDIFDVYLSNLTNIYKVKDNIWW
jgi:hypothetical protein